MKKLLAMALFCLPVFGQAAYTGAGSYSGSAVYASGGSGAAPLTYSARTDNCATGAESGCSSGKSTGEAGSAMSFLERTSDAVPFSEEAGVNSTATDPDFGAFLVMATDENTNNFNGSGAPSSTPYKTSWMMGSDGEWDPFSQDEKFLLASSSAGDATILLINPASIHAQTCATNACVTLSGLYTAGVGCGAGNTACAPGWSSYLAHNGSFSFSRVVTEPNVLYERATVPYQVNRLIVCPSATAYANCPGSIIGYPAVYRSLYIDFTSDSPAACSVIESAAPGNTSANGYSASWTGSFQVANDGSLSYGMTGGYDWQASWSVTANDTFILPVTNGSSTNAGKDGFQATAGGATSATEPAVWCQTAGCTVTDGSVIWTNIGALAGQGPGFDVVIYRPAGTAAPGCSRINTRVGKIYRGTGNTAPAGYMTTNDQVACTRAGTYPSACAMPDRFTLHEVEQAQNGQYLAFSPTGGEGAGPSSPTAYNYGTLSCQASNTSWQGAWSAGATYGSNNVVSYGGLYYTASSLAGNLNQEPDISPTYWSVSESYCGTYFFDTTSTLVAPLTDWIQGQGHAAAGYLRKYYNNRYRSMLYGVACPTCPVINGHLNPGTPMIPAPLPCDDHGTYRNAGTNDLTPIFTSTTDVPAWYTRYTAACYEEICAFGSDGSGLTYRFAHTYNWSSTASFQVHSSIGVISPLGDLFAVSTDMAGTRGSNTQAAAACNKMRGMYQPAAGMSLTINNGVGDTVFPVSSNSGWYVFQTSIAGATSGNAPAGGWGQISPVTITAVSATSSVATYTYTTTGNSVVTGGTIVITGLTNAQFNGSGSPAGTGITIAAATGSSCGTSCTFTVSGSYTPISTTVDSGTGYSTQAWGAAVLENVGVDNCRGDIVIVDALSAHAAP